MAAPPTNAAPSTTTVEQMKEALVTYESEMYKLPPNVLLNAFRVLTCHRMTQQMGQGLDDNNALLDAESMKQASRAYETELEKLPMDARIHSFRVISCFHLAKWMQKRAGDVYSSLDAETLGEINRAFNQWAIITRVSNGEMKKYQI